MSFEYPDGWNITEINNSQSVEIHQGKYDWAQVILLGATDGKDAFTHYNDEITLLSKIYTSRGNYTDDVSHVNYQYFTGRFNDTPINIYIFTKNGKYYELRGPANQDVFYKILLTIK